MAKKPAPDIECMICGETPCGCRAQRANTRKPTKEPAPAQPAPATVPPVTAPARSSALEAMRAAAQTAPSMPMITTVRPAAARAERAERRAEFVPPVVVKTDEQLFEEEAIRLLAKVGFLGKADLDKYRMIIDDALTPEQERQLWRARRRATQSEA